VKGTLLIEVLSSLTPQEFSRFGAFLKSPLYNKGSRILSLYTLLKAEKANGFSSLDKQKIYKKVYKDNNFNDQKLRKLLHDFYKLLEKFIALCEYEKDFMQEELSLLRALRERKLKRAFTRQLVNVKAKQGSPFDRNIEYYRDRIYIGYEEDMFYLEKTLNTEETRLKPLEDSLDNYFIITKLDLFRSMISDSYLANKNIRPGMWMKDNIIKRIEENIEAVKKEHPFIYTEYLMYMLIEKTDADSYYFELKAFINKNGSKINNSELRILYSSMMNYCAMSHNKGKQEFKNEMFAIIKKLEKKSLLFTQNSHVDYINAVTLALDLKQFMWAKKFIEEYKGVLEEEQRNDAYNLALGKYYYALRNYDNALHHLKIIGYMNFYYYFFINRLLLKIYYEKREHDGMLSVIDAMKHFLLRKNTIPAYYRDSNKKFIKYFNKLLSCKTREEAHSLKSMLSAEASFAEKNWLMEKAGLAD
jgi:hypothetical protein